jgi:dTDP-4-dehydrorhamnose 3,5-epimerase
MRECAEQRINFVPLQVNTGSNFRTGTLPGVHFQVKPAVEPKLMRCKSGAIFDVVVDFRTQSLSHRKWYGAELRAEDYQMLYGLRVARTGTKPWRIIQICST